MLLKLIFRDRDDFFSKSSSRCNFFLGMTPLSREQALSENRFPPRIKRGAGFFVLGKEAPRLLVSGLHRRLADDLAVSARGQTGRDNTTMSR
jgi:hypothetical protein